MTQVDLKILKKGGSLQKWNADKIVIAAKKSAQSIGKTFTTKELKALITLTTELARLNAVDGSIPVAKMHLLVVKALSVIDTDVSAAYQNFRRYKEESANSWEEVTSGAQRILTDGSVDNANFDSSLNSTKASLTRSEFTKEVYKKKFLPLEMRKAIEIGFLYVHDLSDLIFNGINCCLFDMGNVLKNGFEMSNLSYSEPKMTETALKVIGDVMLTTTAQQFGGFTVPDIDKVLLPYVKKSIAAHKKKAYDLFAKTNHLTYSPLDLEDFALKEVWTELIQGFQGIEMKLNSVPSARGDFAFTTFSFANIDLENSEDQKLQILICKAILEVRMKGNGKEQKPATFPKLVFMHNEGKMKGNKEYEELFNLSVKCTAKCIYPDYLSVDQNSFFADIYKQYGLTVPPMGCRAYLSKFFNEEGALIYTGRANIGAVSLNLPMIWQASKGKTFYKDLSYYMQLIRDFHINRYDAIANNYCSSNPMAFCQGGLYKGNKNPSDKIGYDIVKSFTASFGITALNELCVLMEGSPLHKTSHENIKKVINFINDKIDSFKEEDGYLYALYGTPAESLCGTQAKQFREQFGVIKGVSDREYLSNSFHMHVTAQLTPSEKQDLEAELFHMILGGHISYTRSSNGDNLESISAIIKRAMELGLYFGVNQDLVICTNCGHRPKGNKVYDLERCPVCNSSKIIMQNRLCGYVGWGKINGVSRFNAAKLAEVSERISM